MEAICRTWEKPLVIEEGALKSGGGGADEFLSRGRNGLRAGAIKKKGEEYDDIFIREPPPSDGDSGLMIRLHRIRGTAWSAFWATV